MSRKRGRGKKTPDKKGMTRRDALRLGAVIFAIAGGILLSWASHETGNTIAAHQAAMLSPAAAADTSWNVGELRGDGLRIIPSGRSDAAAVLDPDQFRDAKVRNAYRIAREIPEVLNQLYCWCGCENRGVHRSSLACFEDLMGVDCDVCRGTVEIAYEMVQKGITDAATIQAAVDASWAPPGARA